jgi:hypothetical protein
MHHVTMASPWYSKQQAASLASLCQAFGFGAAIGSDACLSNCHNDTPDRKRSVETLKSQQQKAKALVVQCFPQIFSA